MGKPIYLFVVPFFPSDSTHGGSYIYDQVKAIAALNTYRVVVLMGTKNISQDGDYNFNGIDIFRFREYNLPSMLWAGFFDKINVKEFDKALRRLDIEYTDIEIVHSHVIRQGLYSNYLKQKNPKILTILQHHGFDVLGLNDGRFSKYDWHRKHSLNYGKKLCNDIDLHIGVSKATINELINIKDINIKDSYVLYNGIDRSLFHPKTFNKRSRFTIGCVANFWKIKDQITLIKAVEILTQKGLNIKAAFVGVGATLNECEEYVKDHSLSNFIDFLQPMPHDSLIDFYNSIDLFVLPSYWDTLGCVYLEAYACGVPFMAAEGTGIKELIPEADYSRWISPKSDSVKLAEMILDFIKHRYKQELTISIDINSLIHDFIDYIDNKLTQQK